MDLWLTSIDPFSTLPSYFELFMMHSVTTSLQNTTYNTLNSLLLQLDRYVGEKRLARSDDVNISERSKSESFRRYVVYQYHRLLLSLLTISSKSTKHLSKNVSILHLLLTLALNNHQLKNNSATFAEGIYGGRRSKLTPDTSGNEATLMDLEKKDALIATGVESFVPYLKRGCDELYDRLVKEESDSASRISLSGGGLIGLLPPPPPPPPPLPPPPVKKSNNLFTKLENLLQIPQLQSKLKNQTLQQKAKALFRYLYPFLHTTYSGTYFMYQWSFLFGYTLYFSPILHVCGQVVRRVTRDDLPKASSSQGLDVNEMTMTKTKTSASDRRDNALNAIRYAFILGVSSFFMYGWVVNARNNYRRRLEDGRLLNRRPSTSFTNNTRSEGEEKKQTLQPPQQISTLLPLNPKIVLTKSLCPICKQTRVNPTVATSGFVFCYRCLLVGIRENGGFCPVSGVVCTESMVVRLFEN